jgi:four helix bundle protein
MTPSFDHEKLEVYRESIAFCAWVGEFLPLLPSKISARDQLDRASTSTPLNRAEGNGKFSSNDRARFLEIARGSALECAACLDVLVARKLAISDQAEDAKRQLAAIVRMLMGLLKRFSERASVLNEEETDYAHREDQEQDHDQEQERERNA